ncbi:MAG: sigma 54-interacting transcriptional regulator [Bacteroidota bacterium]
MEHFIVKQAGTESHLAQYFWQQTVVAGEHSFEELSLDQISPAEEDVPSVLLIDDDAADLFAAYEALRDRFRCYIYEWWDVQGAVEIITRLKPWLFVMDMSCDREWHTGGLVNWDGDEVIKQIKENPELSDIRSVIFTNYPWASALEKNIEYLLYVQKNERLSRQQLQEKTELAAIDYLKRRNKCNQQTAEEYLARCRENLFVSKPASKPTDQFKAQFVKGESDGTLEVLSLIQKYARAEDLHVLITGERGTGKEEVAKEIHHASSRATQEMLSVNCAAIDKLNMSRELFGNEGGRFVDARQASPGYFEAANNSTIFLDEIGELSVEDQAKLLRVIQFKQVTRVGGTVPRPVNVRVLAATRRDIENMVETDAFDAALFDRLKSARIHLLPLRERMEDIPALINHFLSLSGRNITFDDSFLNLLLWHDWPDNVRGLKGEVDKAILGKADGARLTSKDLPGLERAQITRLRMRELLENIDSKLRREFSEALWTNWDQSVLFLADNKKLGDEAKSAIRSQERQRSYYETKLARVIKNLDIKRLEATLVQLLSKPVPDVRQGQPSSDRLQRYHQAIQQRVAFNEFTAQYKKRVYNDRPPYYGIEMMNSFDIWNSLLLKDAEIDLGEPMLTDGIKDHILKAGIMCLAMIVLDVGSIYEFELLRLFFSLKKVPRDRDSLLKNTKILIGAFCDKPAAKSREFYESVKHEFLLGLWEIYKTRVAVPESP